MPRIANRFTVYDIMEAKGVFAANPANPDSRGEDNQPLYKGPVRFPMMFYHPEGEERIRVPAEILTDRNGSPVIDYETGKPKMVGEQREIITRVANDAAEEAALRAEGWHDHPAKAMAAAGREVPAVSSDQRIRELEEQMGALQAQLDQAAATKEIQTRRKAQRASAA